MEIIVEKILTLLLMSHFSLVLSHQLLTSIPWRCIFIDSSKSKSFPQKCIFAQTL